MTTNSGTLVPDNQNALTSGLRDPMLLQDVWFLEKPTHFDREVIPKHRIHTKAKIFSNSRNKRREHYE